MQDTIEREITVAAPITKVYAAITDPAQITKWFPDTIEGSLTPGEQTVLGFGDMGSSPILVVAATPTSYFSYRWIPGETHFEGDLTTVTTTLVEFHLTEHDGKTTIRLLESGFASLPREQAEKAFADNSGGWEYMMDRLEKLMNEA